MFFEDNIDDAKYCGHLYGLGTSYVQNGTSFENSAFPSTAAGSSHTTTNNVDSTSTNNITNSTG